MEGVLYILKFPTTNKQEAGKCETGIECKIGNTVLYLVLEQYLKER
jgi:hypothetical protein